MDKAIEAAARALYAANEAHHIAAQERLNRRLGAASRHEPWMPWEGLSERVQEGFRARTRAAILAWIDESLEPSHQMIMSAYKEYPLACDAFDADADVVYGALWKAMLAQRRREVE